VRYLPKEDMELRMPGASEFSSMTVLSPFLFESVRSTIGLERDAYFASLTGGDLSGGGKEASGKSGELFFMTHDGNFILKTVTDGEIDTLVGMLVQYREHLASSPDSLLTRYVGAYRLKCGSFQTGFVVMNNVFIGAPNLDVMYDLKGTTEDRWVDPTKHSCLKDNNFQGTTLFTSDDTARAIHVQLRKDTTFLQSRGIMDYSLMVAIARKDHKEWTQTATWSKLMGGLPGTECEGGAVAPVSRSCVVFLGIVDMLVTYGVKKIAANAVKSATIGWVSEIDTIPPTPYAERFRAFLAKKIVGDSAVTVITKVSPEIFETPMPPMSRSGGTASLFRSVLKGDSQEPEAAQSSNFWLAKDLGRAADEVTFYEAAMKIKDVQGFELLKWLTPYKGVCKAPCQVKEGVVEETDVMILRNCRDGYAACRMLDIKIGYETAVAGWQGKSSFGAMKQSYVDSFTNSADQGFRLEGFDGPPPVMTSIEQLMDDDQASKWTTSVALTPKQCVRMFLQRLPASEFMTHFLDLHSVGNSSFAKTTKYAEEPRPSGGLQVVEAQELILLQCIEKLAGFLDACRKVPVPQQWIGSSVMLAFDSLADLSQEVLSGGDVTRVHIFDWGRSELNTPTKHEMLSEEEQAERQKYWGYYCGGVARLLYDCCDLYVTRFWKPKKTAVLTMFDKDFFTEDDFIGVCTVPLAECSATDIAVKSWQGKQVTTGMLFTKDSKVKVSMSKMSLSEGSRLESGWKIKVHRGTNIPWKDLTSDTDAFVKVAVVPDDADVVEAVFQEELGQQFVQRGAHQTTVAMNQKEPVFEEEFEVAMLKPAHKSRFLSALEVAIGKKMGDADVESLFQASASSVRSTERSEMECTFAKMCFNDLQVDKKIGAGQDLVKLPETDALRMLHFAQWLASSGDPKKAVFAQFLIQNATGNVTPEDAVKYCKAFATVAGTSELEQLADSGSVSVDTLRKVAVGELRESWTQCVYSNAANRFYIYTAVSNSGARAAWKNAAAHAVKLVAILNSRRAEADAMEAAAVPAAEGDAPESEPAQVSKGKIVSVSDRVAAAIPVMVQTTIRFNQALAEQSSTTGVSVSDTARAERRAFSVPRGGCAFSPSPGTKELHFESFGSNLLEFVQSECSQITDGEMLASLGNPEEEIRVLSTNSKSGEVFLMSGCGRFIIKTISDPEAERLIQILPAYRQHFAANRTSMLGRYLAIYRISLESGSSRYITVMHSVFDTPLKIGRMYDLKGSTHKRFVKSDAESVRKDQDWLNDGLKLKVTPAQAQALAADHSSVTSFLASCNVMDYSILLGVAADTAGAPDGQLLSEDGSEAYFVGVIDFLVDFGFKKKAEFLLHQLQGVGQTASVMDPQSYAARQCKFFVDSILPPS